MPRLLPLLLIALLAAFPALAQKVNDFPQRDDPLHLRVDAFNKLMQGNHWNEGTMMQHIIFPPAGTERPLVGNQEDCCDHTAMFLAAYAFQYAATGDEQARAWAKTCMEGILRLEKVTGVPGWVARSLNQTDKPLWHEKCYFFPMEWHASESMPGYRWQGDLSSDKFTTLCYAMSIYYDLCGDEAQRAVAAGFIDRFVGRVVDHNFRMVDIDNKMTLWGNFCPDLPHQPLNSLEMLAGLRVAYHMTQDDRYFRAYRKLVETYGYADHAIMAKVLWPEQWKTPWDDHLAARALYPLLRYETDADLRQKYHMCLNRHGHDWKGRATADPEDLALRMLDKVLNGEEELDADMVAGIKGMWGFDRHRRNFTIPGPDGPKTVEAEEEGSAMALVHAYWFGRHHGFIAADW